MIANAKRHKKALIKEANRLREFNADQAELRRTMKRHLIECFFDDAVVKNFYKMWITSVYLFEMMTALRDHVTVKRNRIKNTLRVFFFYTRLQGPLQNTSTKAG